jgi:DNA invertase Pin-like site-specific DNA recombinase
VGFQSLHEAIDTTTSSGKLVFHVFGALAEFERDITLERTLAGLTAARACGRKGGRPRNFEDKKKRHAVTLHGDPTNSVQDICRTLEISRVTLYRYLAEHSEADDRSGIGDPMGRGIQRAAELPITFGCPENWTAKNSTKSITSWR